MKAYLTKPENRVTGFQKWNPVALQVGNRQTIMIDAEEALRMAAELLQAARDYAEETKR